MSDAGENGDSAMPSYFDAVPQTADTAPDDGLGDWSGIINPNYLTEPVFTDDQLAAVRALPELAGLGVDITQPPPDFLAGTGLTPSYADFDFRQYNPGLLGGPVSGSAPGGGQGGEDLVYRFRPGQQDSGPMPIGLAPLNSPNIAVPLAAQFQGGSPVAANFSQPGAAPAPTAPQTARGSDTPTGSGGGDSGTDPQQGSGDANGGTPASTDSKLPPNVDWQFIRDREGEKTTGYVPEVQKGVPSPKSGVTIGHGFDLNGRSADDLAKLGLSPDLVAKLTAHSEYETYQGAAADAFVKANPLNITKDEEKQIDQVAFPEYYSQIAAKYNADAAKGLRFQDLLQGAQTAIVSLAYNYGPNLAKATPVFWRQVTNGQWQDARDNLNNFHDNLQPRRTLEAGQMQGAIPPTPTPRPDF